jgi:hypothetical protein
MGNGAAVGNPSASPLREKAQRAQQTKAFFDVGHAALCPTYAGVNPIGAQTLPVTAEFNLRFFIKCTVNFLSMLENSVFQLHQRHHERHRPLRTSSWTENALVGEIC